MESLFILLAIFHAFTYFAPTVADVTWDSDQVDLALALCWYLAAENLTIRSKLKKLEFLYGKPSKKDAGSDVQSSDSH